jgi:hypothetical protein
MGGPFAGGRRDDRGRARHAPFAAHDASHEAVFHKAMFWIQGKIIKYRPELIVWEVPPSSNFRKGTSNTDTTLLLYGLPAIVGAIAYMHKIYVRKAETRAVKTIGPSATHRASPLQP